MFFKDFNFLKYKFILYSVMRTIYHYVLSVENSDPAYSIQIPIPNNELQKRNNYDDTKCNCSICSCIFCRI